MKIHRLLAVLLLSSLSFAQIDTGGGGGGGGAVASVFGRTGGVVATAGDYTLNLLGDPAANKSFTMGTRTLNYNFTGNWGAGFGYSITSNGSNAATGPLFQLSSGSATTHDVFQACAQGTSNCAKLTSAGLFTTIGTATIDATKLSGVLPFANMAQPFVTNAQTSTYQVLAADFTGCKTIPVASGTFTITLVASGTQPASGQCVDVINYGSGVVTVARSGQNINGAAANLTIAAGSASAPLGLHVVSDGTNYVAQTWGASGGGSADGVVFPWGGFGQGWAPADATTYYVAWMTVGNTGPSAWDIEQSKFLIPLSCTIKTVNWTVNYVNGNAASNEGVTLTLYKNNVSAAVLSTTDDWSSTYTHRGTATGLSVAATSTDVFQVRIATPTWATNPTSVGVAGTLFCQ